MALPGIREYWGSRNELDVTTSSSRLSRLVDQLRNLGCCSKKSAAQNDKLSRCQSARPPEDSNHVVVHTYLGSNGSTAWSNVLILPGKRQLRRDHLNARP